jgi:hypothetical protein
MLQRVTGVEVGAFTIESGDAPYFDQTIVGSAMRFRAIPLYERDCAAYDERMTKTARIAAAISAPVLGSLAAIGFAIAPAAPAAAASPITITSNSIIVVIPPILYLDLKI